MTEEEKNMITVHIMGKAHEVPAGLTIMKAMEYAGYQFIRGSGCRAGFCGACATVYRLAGEYKLRTALACQTAAEDGMFLTQLPFVPANRQEYHVAEIEPGPGTLAEYFPEITRCVSCNTCTKSCPQDLDVMDYIQMSIRGDFEAVSKLSFDCIQCGLCVARCPAEISHYHVAQLARRLYGKYQSPVPQHLMTRLEEIEAGKFDEAISELKSLNATELEERYTAREIEKIERGEVMDE